MAKRKKNSNIQYRFLSDNDFSGLHKTMLAAFADYFVPMKSTEEEYKNHIAQNSVDLNLSVGAFAENEMIGFTLNGFGVWNGKQTAYDAGTGVIPTFRRKGIGGKMFDFMLPKLREIGIEQMLLEVITENEKATKLYEKIGFEKTRKLFFFEQTSPFTTTLQNEIEIRAVKKIDWELTKAFWDKNTSWQFSVEAVERSLSPKVFFEAFLENKGVGYSVLFPKAAMIAQIAVDKKHRRKGIASKLLETMQYKISEDKKLRLGNVDENLESLINFAKRTNFKQTISQNEMMLKL